MSVCQGGRQRTFGKFRQPVCHVTVCVNIQENDNHGMAGNARQKPGRRSHRKSSHDDCPLLPFIPDGCHDALPAAGNRNGTDVNNRGSNGYYWSATLNENNSNNAYYLNFNDGNWNWNNNNRNNGHTVRPVTELTGTAAAPSPPFRISREQLLLDLYKAFKDARRHKRKKPYVLQFSENLEENLIDLRDEIIEGRYTPRPSTCFIITDPKVREVFAADFRDRIVHHLYYNYTHVLFERTFITDSYSCIKNRGTHWGIDRLEHHIRSVSRNYTRPCYVMKLDIRGYFMHIRRERLLQLCRDTLLKMRTHRSDEKGKTWSEKLDYGLVLYLTEVIIMNNPLIDCHRRGAASDWDDLPPSKSLFYSPQGCGLPIGNLTSQLFSNVYLNHYDQFMKRVLRCKAYGRYVDDSYVVSNHKSALRELIPRVEAFLEEELGLTLHPYKLVICDVKHGVGFLGAYLKPYRRYIHNESLRRVKEGVAALRQVHDAEALRASIDSYLGVMSHYASYNLRRKVFCTQSFLFRYGYFGGGVHTFKVRKNSMPRTLRKTNNSVLLNPCSLFAQSPRRTKRTQPRKEL